MSQNSKQSMFEKSKTPTTEHNNLKPFGITKNSKAKTTEDARNINNNKKEVTIQIKKKIHIITKTSDPQTVIINGTAFRKEVVKLLLNNIKKQQKSNTTENKKTATISPQQASTSEKLLSNFSKSTPGDKSETSNTKPPPSNNQNTDGLFNTNHKSSKKAKFLEYSFQTSSTLQSILADIVSLKKEYDGLENNLLEKKIEELRARNNLPNMSAINNFSADSIDSIESSEGEETESENTSVSSESIPKLVPLYPGTNRFIISNLDSVPKSTNVVQYDSEDSDKLIIDESSVDDEFSEEIKTLRNKRLTKILDWECPLCEIKLKSYIRLKYHLKNCKMLPMKEKRSSIFDIKIDQVFSKGNKIVNCDKCSFEATEKEMETHLLVHLKRAKTSHELTKSKKSDLQKIHKNNVGIELDEVILVDDNDD